jgi:Tol biopolymer transport system component
LKSFRLFDAVASQENSMKIINSSIALLLASCLNAAAPRVMAAGPVVALERVSVATDGTQGNGDSQQGVISADGRYVAFQSETNTLAGSAGIVLRDRLARSTEMVSVGVGGVQQNGLSFTPAISADGRFVAFNSLSTNLVPGGTSGTRGIGNVFVRDRLLGTTAQASVNDGGSDTDGGGTSVLNDTPSNWMSGDGRYVVFRGYTKLTPNATNDHVHLYRRDLVANATELVDVNPSGVNANGDSDGGSISADGRFVVFVSSASDIVIGASQFGVQGIFVRDMVSGVTTGITPTLSTPGLCTLGDSGGTGDNYRVSPNGRFAAFYSNCPDIAPSQQPNDHVFLRDLVLGVTSYERFSESGAIGKGDETYLSATNNGRFLIGETQSTTVITGATGVGDIYLRDLAAGHTYRISQRVDTGAGGDGGSAWPMSSTSGHVVFSSAATNLVAAGFE